MENRSQDISYTRPSREDREDPWGSLGYLVHVEVPRPTHFVLEEVAQRLEALPDIPDDTQQPQLPFDSEF